MIVISGTPSDTGISEFLHSRHAFHIAYAFSMQKSRYIYRIISTLKKEVRHRKIPPPGRYLQGTDRQVATYGISGKPVAPDTKDLVIVRYPDGSVAKVVNRDR